MYVYYISIETIQCINIQQGFNLNFNGIKNKSQCLLQCNSGTLGIQKSNYSFNQGIDYSITFFKNSNFVMMTKYTLNHQK